jgi:hypothetical protein
MKFLTLFILLSPIMTWAFPSKSDYVKHIADYKGSPVVMERSVIGIDGDAFTVHSLITYKSQIISEKTVTVPSSFLYSNAKVENVFKTCESREGAISYVSVMGKTIKACEFYHEDSGLTYMIGMVPFGQVKFQEYLGDGEFLDFNVVEFR